MNSNFKTQLSSGCGRQKNITGSEENSVNDEEILSTVGFFSFEGTWGKKKHMTKAFQQQKSCRVHVSCPGFCWKMRPLFKM